MIVQGWRAKNPNSPLTLAVMKDKPCSIADFSYQEATMDFYVACCIIASIPQCRELCFVFEKQVAL